MSIAETDSFDQYMERYGKLLGKKATDSLDPLHRPDRDPVPEVLGTLLRKPFEPQAHVIAACVKALDRQKATLLCGEQGSGKTLMGMAACHGHAGEKPYRALVMCPDHLVSKWVREVEETIPGARVMRFDNWREVLALAHDWKARRLRPSGPEWYVLGRDQSKFESRWRGAFAPRLVKQGESKTIPLAERTIVVPACPRCGRPPKRATGDRLLTEEEILRNQQACRGHVFRFVGREEARQRLAEGVLEGQVELTECGEPLWQREARPFRYAPAKIVHKKMPGWLDYFVCDEVHEEKSPISAQAQAMGKLAASARKVVALTGTLVGGYADHVFPLLFRLAPRSLLDEGFEWGKPMAFSMAYGRIETTITTREGGESSSNSQSMGKRTTTRRDCKPGIMPTLFGRHLMGNAAFLSLEDVSAALPEYRERVVPVAMDPDLSANYGALEGVLRATVKQMLVRGDKRLLGPMLYALLCYPDHPHEWSTIGYREKDGRFVPVVTPENMEPERTYAKEQAVIDLCLAEKAEGRQVWVYCTMSNLKDCVGRLVERLEAAGLRAKALRSSVDRKRREEWIEKQGRSVDVMVSHPRLVETGLDLFSKKPGGHNYPTLVFYQTGYNLFTMRQAGRRAWRIGQPEECRVFYLYYAGTMQERAVALMGKKLAASEALEGKFSGEGLAALAGDESAEMQLARALADQIDEPADRVWAKVGSASFTPRVVTPVTESVTPVTPVPGEDEVDRILTRPIPGGPPPMTRAELAELFRQLAKVG